MGSPVFHRSGGATTTGGRGYGPVSRHHLAADKLTTYRQRLKRETTERRGRKDDPLYKHRRALLTKTNYYTERQRQRLKMLWAIDDDYAGPEVTWFLYQNMNHECSIRASEEIGMQGTQPLYLTVPDPLDSGKRRSTHSIKCEEPVSVPVFRGFRYCCVPKGW
ncbi:transposase [Corynebacterium minutissimum]